MNKTKTKLLAILFVVFAVVMVVFGSGREVWADESMMMRAVIEPSLTVSISSNAPTLTIEPSANGKFGSAGFSVGILTNNSTGYTLSMTPTNVNLLLNGSASPYIYALSNGSFTAGTFTLNRWGISINGGEFNDGSNYHKIESGETLLIDTNTSTGNTANSVTIDYGAKLDLSIKPGTYSTTVNFAALAKPNVLYMQDVDIWESTLAVGDEVEAVDNRDGKAYYVARLEDGNIWMTQNLDHDIVSTPNFYTYYNTDIGHGSTENTYAKWTGAATYATNSLSSWVGTLGAPESYDPGNLCWNGTFDSDYNTGTFNTYFVTCGDRHRHAGNYYNWTAAVAMDDTSTYYDADTDVDQSICPAGWRLPKISGSKSFVGLVSDLTLTARGASGNVHTSPVYFVYGGKIQGIDGNAALEGVAYMGNYFTSVPAIHGRKRVMYFDVNSSVITGDYADMTTGGGSGQSIRCVARPAADAGR